MLNTKVDILKNLEKSTICWSPLISIVGKKIHGSQWLLSAVTTFFKISSFMFNRRKKLTGLEGHEREYMYNSNTPLI